MPDGYNGWSNRETWATALWLGNDEALYNEVRDIVERNDRDVSKVADDIKNMVDDISNAVYNGEANIHARSMILDIGSLYRVDWEEIAKTECET
jgi:hypothetical protein